jgi:hypothetical protein
MPNFTLKDYLSEVEMNLDELKEELFYSNAFCLSDDNPFKHEAIVWQKKLNQFISQSITKAVTEALREIVPAGLVVMGNREIDNFSQGFNEAIDQIETNIKKLIG